MEWLAVSTFVLVNFLSSALAQSVGNFLTPSGPDLSAEKNYTIGQTVKLQWETDFPIISICLTQYDHDDDCEWLQSSVENRNSYLWDVDTERDHLSNPRFHLRIINSGNDSKYFWSPGFFLWPAESEDGEATSSSSAPSSTAADETSTGTSSTGKSSAAGATESRPSATAVLTPSPAPSSGGMSTGAKVGLGVAIPIAFLLGCALVFLFMRRGAKRKLTTTTPPPGSSAMTAAKGYYGGHLVTGSRQEFDRSPAVLGEFEGSQYYPQQPYSPPQEMSAAPPQEVRR
ncbi:MAG: hypothetical protein M1837_005776 [Sclerophora amabilis]|nr:MAG: hypothetical protein M1837_005776 [Sclerophora amabilis]